MAHGIVADDTKKSDGFGSALMGTLGRGVESAIDFGSGLLGLSLWKKTQAAGYPAATGLDGESSQTAPASSRTTTTADKPLPDWVKPVGFMVAAIVILLLVFNFAR